MKRKVLTILLALCVALTMMPTVAMAAETLTGTALTKVDVTSEGTLSLVAGNSYYLNDDITISKTIEISGTVTLDLNGHVLKYENASTKGSVIIVGENANLILNDSNPSATHGEDTGLSSKGGVITGGTGTIVFYVPEVPAMNTICGGGVYITDGGKFTMNAGSIENCTAHYGGGVGVSYFDKAEFTMNGGSILNCSAKKDNSDRYDLSSAGGVFVGVNGIFTMNEGVIKNCTEPGNSKFTAEAVHIYSNAIMYANGGKIDGTVYIDKDDEVEGKIDSTVNSEKQTTFNKNVNNRGEIAAGIFEKKVNNGFESSGSIYTGLISGGVFNKDVENRAADESCKSEIKGGKFSGKVTNDSYAVVSGGDFSAAILAVTGKIGTVSFNLSGGNGDSPTQWRYNSTATEPETAPARGGYNFDGWYNGDEKWDFGTNITSDLTLTAKFTPIKTSSGSHRSYVQKPTVSLGTDVKTEKAADGSTVYTTAEGSIVLSRDGRTAEITPADGYEVANVSVNGKDMGAVTTLTGLKTGDEIVVDFQKTAETKKAEVKAAAAKLSPIARSVKTAKGNIKVTLKFDKETESLIKEMQELGYTVKYKFYRSTKKSSGYKAMLTKSGRSYTNTNGKAGTKYYYKARVQIYDQDGKLIAQTALKQCQYASRTWGK